MNPIAEIRRRLAEHPGAQCEEGKNWIRYLPSSDEGFVVELSTDSDAYTVSFDGWHEKFRDAESAVKCFMFGLSDTCRLKTVLRGGKPHKWTVKSLKDGEWTEDSTTGHLFFAFWRQAHVSYRQNTLLASTGDE